MKTVVIPDTVNPTKPPKIPNSAPPKVAIITNNIAATMVPNAPATDPALPERAAALPGSAPRRAWSLRG